MNKAKILKNAEKFVLQGKIPAAISEYQKIVELDPNDLPILNIIGDLYVRLGNTFEGLKYFNRLATAYIESGFKVKAIAIYKKITKLDPKSLEARQRLADLYALQGLMSEARSQYLELADAYQARSNLEAAAEALQKLYSSDPSDAALLDRLVELEEIRGNKGVAVDLLLGAAERAWQRRKVADAKTLLERAQQINAEAPSVKLLLAKILFGEGQSDSAVKVLHELEHSQSSPDIQLDLWECFYEANHLDEAGEIARRLFDRDHAHFPLLFSLGDRHLSSAQFDQALSVLRPLIQSLSLEPFGGRLSEMLQRIVTEAPDHLPAIEQCVEVNRRLGQTQRLSVALEHLASYHIKRENLSGAMAVYEELLNIDPNNQTVQKGMERLQERMVRLASAGGTERKTVEEGSVQTVSMEDAPEPVQVTTREEFDLREPEKREATKPDKTLHWSTVVQTTDVLNNLILEGEFLAGYGLLNRAAQLFEELVQIEPEHTLALKRLVEIYVALGQSRVAAEYCEKLSRLALKKDSVEEAQLWIQKAVDLSKTVQHTPVEEEAGLRSSSVIPQEEDKKVSAVELPETLYDLSEELAQVSQSSEDAAEFEGETSLKEAQASWEEEERALQSTLGEIDFYMEQGFWAEARTLIEKTIEQFPHTRLLWDRLERCDTMTPQAESGLMIDPSTVKADRSDAAPTEQPSMVSETLSEVPSQGEAPVAASMMGDSSRDSERTVEQSPAQTVEDVFAEFDVVEGQSDTSADFSTHYNLAIAFREMGLVEEAISEAQKSISLLNPQVQKQEYLSVCSLLGLCMVESKSFPEAAEWLERGMKVLEKSESSEEYLSLEYDLANAYQMAGNNERALEAFSDIQNKNPGFRDVHNRLQQLQRASRSK